MDAHVIHQGLGPKLELTSNPQWGEHRRKEALAHAALVDRHLANGRDWLLGGPEPTFTDITLCTAIAFSKFKVIATPLDERFDQLDRYWQAWTARPAFKSAYSDGGGLAELKGVRAQTGAHSSAFGTTAQHTLKFDAPDAPDIPGDDEACHYRWGDSRANRWWGRARREKRPTTTIGGGHASRRRKMSAGRCKRSWLRL